MSQFRATGSGDLGADSRAHLTHHSPQFEILCDKGGTVTFGWAAPNVFYTRFEGRLSAQNGRIYADRLVNLVGEAQTMSLYCDSSILRDYDLSARHTFVRVLSTNRSKFKSLVFLTWAEGISAVAKSLIETLGEPIEVFGERDAFEARLLEAAPGWRDVIGLARGVDR